jgi:hypothetical protein
MPKETAKCSGVVGRAPRKALCVKKGTKKDSGKAKVQKKNRPAALEVPALPEHVSASPTPPTPSSPRSPTYDREPWWDPVISLTRRMDAVTASIKELTDRVKCLEEERDKHRAGGSLIGNV